MEIISYLDDRQTNFSKKGFKPIKLRQNPNSLPQYTMLSTEPYTFAQTISLKATSAKSIASDFLRTTIWLITKKFHLIVLLLSMAAAGVLVSYSLMALVEAVHSIAKPVELAYLSPNEIEVLDSAMEKFALFMAEDIDKDGNILNSQTIEITDITLSEPVKFSTYIVKSGDTISTISRKFGLTNISTLIGVNGIGNVRQLRAGQKLTIPSIDGLTYTVQPNDTIAGLSARHNIAVEDILDVNDLSSSVLQSGQELFIPGARLDSASLRKAMGELFIYPISGKWRLSSKFGKRADPFTGVPSSHTGIDLAISQGTPIKAAMSGKIIAVGYTNVYGNYVIIDHENGYQTLYAHMQKPCPLRKGQRVGQGDKIGLVGNTGYSTGPHLHFTVYKNGKLIDPLTVLK